MLFIIVLLPWHLAFVLSQIPTSNMQYKSIRSPPTKTTSYTMVIAHRNFTRHSAYMKEREREERDCTTWKKENVRGQFTLLMRKLRGCGLSKCVKTNHYIK